MDPMQEQIALGAREMQAEQRDIVADLTRTFCERHGGTPEQLAEAAGINSGRFASYVDGRGVTELSADEMSAFMQVCSKLEGRK